MEQLLIENIGELISLVPLVKAQRFTHIQMADLGVLRGAWLAAKHGKIVGLGTGAPPAVYSSWQKIQAAGALITPGLIDCHTHPVFAGDRTHEFAARLEGASYQDIAAAGGGIKYTIEKTRAASDTELLSTTRQRLTQFLQWGVTSVETKTGYGQSVKEELRQLRLLQKLKAEGPQHLVITCLALHDLPADQSNKTLFIRDMSEDLLTQIANDKLADWIDGFVENGYFTVAEASPFFKKAQELGLGIRIHADEFSDSGSALAAASWGAASADHMQHASLEGIEAMRAAGTLAILLPGTSFYTRLPYTQAKKFRDAGCAFAIASDFNPGSCFLGNLPLAASIAALYSGITLPEALVGVTWNAARALRIEDKKGALAEGFDADFVIHRHHNLAQWIADCGQTQASQVFIKGKRYL